MLIGAVTTLLTLAVWADVAGANLKSIHPH